MDPNEGLGKSGTAGKRGMEGAANGCGGEEANGLAHGSADMPPAPPKPDAPPPTAPEAAGASHVGREAGVVLRSSAANDCSSSMVRGDGER
jgi:hypothetical protein